jgi:hypothetical protein
LYVIYFILIVVFGLFISVALVIGFFQTSFQSLSEVEIRRHRLSYRSGIGAAFVLLDRDSSGQISIEELHKFIKDIRPKVSSQQVIATFNQLNVSTIEKVDQIAKSLSKILKGISFEQLREKIAVFLPKEDVSSLTSIDILEFVNGIESITVERLLQFEQVKSSSLFKPIRLAMVFITVMQIWMLALYRTWTGNDEVLDLCCVIFIGIHAIETLFQVLFQGPERYWNFASYSIAPEDKRRFRRYEIEFSQRLDVFIVVLAVSGVIASCIRGERILLRSGAVVSACRIFTLVLSFRAIVYVILKAIMPFFKLLQFLVLIIRTSPSHALVSRL